ncbi:MAG: extracellular solute-binding protein [Thermoleophilia bacterium]|nr:extracellular solute-binding protein [Thermoleophilia bacterium]
MTTNGNNDGMSRRRFMQVNTAAGLTLVLSGSLGTVLQACGGSSDSSQTTSLTAKEISNASGTITVLTFSFYEAPAFNSGPVTAKYAEISSGDEVIAKVRNSMGIDVTATGTNVVGQLLDIDALDPIDTGLIENYTEIDKDVREQPIFTRNGDVYAVPMTITPGFTAWNSDEVDEPKTADGLLDSQYRDRVGLYDDSGTVIQFAQMLGFDIYNFTLEDLDSVKEYMDQLKPNVKTIFVFGDEVQLFARDDISVAFQTFGSLLTSIQENNPAVSSNYLGSLSFVDAWSIPTGATTAAGMNWINNTLTVRSQKSLVKTAGTLPTVPGAIKPEEYPAGLSEPSLSALLKVAPPIPSAPVEGADEGLVTLDVLQKTWSDYKASF